MNFYADRKRGDRPCRKRGDQSEAFSFDDPASFFLSVYIASNDPAVLFDDPSCFFSIASNDPAAVHVLSV